jgi:cell division protein FtsZ
MIAKSDMLLLGVGGGGCAITCAVVKQADVNFKALAVDTDARSSREAGDNAIDFLLIGRDRLIGKGTGGDVASGRVAADDDMQRLDPFLSEVRLAVVVCSLGSGTGGGATPKILDYLSNRGITTLCFATLPFQFEGASRVACAAGITSLLAESADTLITLPLDQLHECSTDDNLKQCVDVSAAIIGAGVALVWRMVCMPGYIQLDSEKIRTLVVGGKMAKLGFASSSDQIEERAAVVLDELSSFPLLREEKGGIRAAEALLVGIIGGDDLRLSEIRRIMKGIKALYNKDVRVEMGTVQDALYNGRIDVVLLAFRNRTPFIGAVAAVQPVLGDEPPVADVLTVVKQTRKAKVRGGSRLSVGSSGRGRFQNCDPTLHCGVDLDVPTYLRYGLNIEK